MKTVIVFYGKITLIGNDFGAQFYSASFYLPLPVIKLSNFY